jgi:hypothetical protein
MTIVTGYHPQSRFRHVVYIKEHPEIYQEADNDILALGMLVRDNAELLGITIEKSETEVTVHLTEKQIKIFDNRKRLAEALRNDPECQRLWAEESHIRSMRDSTGMSKSYKEKYEKEHNDIWFKISKRQVEIEKGIQ